MHGVISQHSSCVLAQGLPERSAALPAAEMPPPRPPALECGLHHWASGGFSPAPEPGGQEGEVGVRAAV